MTHKSDFKSLLSTSLVLLGGAIALLSTGSNLFQPSPTEEPVATSAVWVQNPPAEEPDHFYQAMSTAMSAATLNQAAHSENDWNLVAEYWQRAIQSLQIVPQEHNHYPQVSTKVAEYERNLAYAQQQQAKQAARVSARAAGNKDNHAPLGSSPSTGLKRNQITCPRSVPAAAANQAVTLSNLQFHRENASAQGFVIIGCLTNHSQQPLTNVAVTYQGRSSQNPTFFQGGYSALDFPRLNPGQTAAFKSSFTLNPQTNRAEVTAVYWQFGTADPQGVSTSVVVVR